MTKYLAEYNSADRTVFQETSKLFNFSCLSLVGIGRNFKLGYDNQRKNNRFEEDKDQQLNP